MIIKTPVTTNYFSAPNLIAQDNTLSDRAARIITYAASLPANWRIIPAQLMKHFGWGRDSTYRALRELCARGYAILKRGKQFAEWIIYTSPQTPESLKATPDAAPKNPDFKNSCQTDALQSNKGLQKTEITTTPIDTAQAHREPLPVETHDVVVVVLTDKIDQQTPTAGDPVPTLTKSTNDTQQEIPHIAPQHQAAAKRALSRLTPEQMEMVLAVFTLQASKTTISNKVGYLISLTKAAIDGTFSPVTGPQAPSMMSLDERLAKEKKRAAEAAERGTMTNQQYFEWLNRQYGNTVTGNEKPAGRIGLRKALGWA